MTLARLCEKSGLSLKVSGYREPLIYFGDVPRHYEFYNDDMKLVYVVSTIDIKDMGLTAADSEFYVRILEFLAYSFHDYGAREITRGVFRYKEERDASFSTRSRSWNC